jgi:MFS family permease
MEEREEALDDLLKHGFFTQIRLTLTEGVLLVSFALLLGASNIVIGILAAIPSLAQLLQVPSIFLVEKYHERKKINLITTCLNRLALLLMALVPFIAESAAGLLLLVLAVFLQATFVAIGSPGWNSWLRDLVPQDRLGSYFSKRLSLSTAVGVPVSLLAGVFVDLWALQNSSAPLIGYSMLFLVAILSGVIGVYYVYKIPEPKMSTPDSKRTFRVMVTQPFHDENFGNLMRFSFVWTLSTALAAPFFSVYLLSQLGLNVPSAIIFTVLTQVASIIFFRLWGRLSDRYSNKSVLQVTVPMYMVGVLLWTFTTLPSYHLFTIPLLLIIHALTGISSAGVVLTSGNIGLKLAPRGEATSYLAARGIVIAVAGAVAPFIGGLLADFFSSRQLSFTVIWSAPEGILQFFTFHLGGLDFVFVISVIVGIYALHRLALVKETGEVNERIVLDAILEETRRGVKTLSTVDGLRQTFQIPIRQRREERRKKGAKFE